jgi:hypothetical protein
MKNILLFSVDHQVIDAVLSQTDWNIRVLIVSNDMYKEMYSAESRIRHIYTRYDFHKNDDLSTIDFDELQHFFYAQLRSENFYLRFVNDYQMAKYDYYRGFALASRIFQENKFDLVLVDGFNEGRPSDMLLTELAKANGIPSYSTDVIFLGKACLYDNIRDEMLPIHRMREISMEEALFYKFDFNELLDSVVYNHPVLEKSYARKIEKIVYALFGQVGVDACSCLYTMSNRKNTMGLMFTERFQLFWAAKKIKRWLDKRAQTVDVQKKYIYFSLHYEPESSISGRGMIDSQLVAIRMLSQLLPEGWFLYVKEHPDQFKYNERRLYGYPVATFKTIRFYEEIFRLPNVVFVKTKTQSKILTENSQAVASLSGTVLAEAITMRKPIMVFASQRTPYRMVKDAYKIRSYRDCAYALKKIEQGAHPQYHDWEDVCQRYLFDLQPHGYNDVIATLASL